MGVQHPTTLTMIFLIPGIGGTAELFSDYRFPVPFLAVDYPRPKTLEMSIRQYAQQLVEHCGIRPGDALVGMSLGGMMACEISKVVEIDQLILISSGTCKEHINPVLRRLGFLGPHMPFSWLQKLPIPAASRLRRRMIQMFREADPVFLNWACSCAPHWEGLENHPRLTQIHGEWDPVFPFCYQRDRIHYRLQRAAHLAVLVQQKEVQQILCRLLIESEEPNRSAILGGSCGRFSLKSA